MKIAFVPTGGASLALEPKLLPDAACTASVNQKPSRGDLRPWNMPLTVASVPAGRGTIYRMGRDVVSNSLYWLSWPGVVHAIHGFISGDATERTYYTGDGAPKQTNNVIGLAGAPFPTAYRQLGVPVPAAAPVVTPNNTGVATAKEYRYYTYTYVTDWEESAPAPVSAQVECKTDDTLAITNIEAPPAGSHGINRVRVYRTQTGQQGDTEFFFLREEIATIGATTDDNRTLGEVMPTDGWLPPPATLSFLTAMWNGMAAAINTVDGSVRYCVAYKPYAWPIPYETLPPDARAVALATFGQRLLVLTTGDPVLVSGSGPDSLDEQPLQFNQSCIAPRSAVGLGHGVAWACPDGLAYYGDAGGAKLITQGILTREDWQAMNPQSIVGGIYEGAYFGLYTQEGVKKGFIVDPVSPGGIFFLEAGYDSLYYDESQDALFVLDGINIKKWDSAPAVMVASARSKVFPSTPRNYDCGRVEASAYPVTVSFDALGLLADQVAKRVAARPDLFTAPTSTSLRYTKVVAGPAPFKLPAGFKAREHQIAVSTANPVQWVAMATSMAELTEG